MSHSVFMRRCLELAAQGRRDVGNGALVGAVLVRDKKIIAEGFHESFGKDHAERKLLQKFEQEIYTEDIVYVNLEPCCHTGKTPPCTDILLERGVKHIVVGMSDPDERVAGKGSTLLRSKGVSVEGPVLRAECEWLNRGFISVRTNHRPWITLKSSHTPDGKIANDDGSPLAITSEEQNVWSHTHLRVMHDAILVGVQTVINDDPKLDTRFVGTRPLSLAPSPVGGGKFCPWRIVLDPQGRVPHTARIVTDEHRSSTIIIVSPEHAENVEELRKNGVHVFPVAIDDGGCVWQELWDALLKSHDGFNGLTSILVEGGQRTWDLFKNARMLDMEVLLISKN